MNHIALVVEYDGTHYHGYQVQDNARTVQSEVEKALSTIQKSATRVTAAGRTDAGVHALGQVISFGTDARMPPSRFAPALNSLLPGDIRVRQSLLAPPGFNARYDAISKTYRYIIIPNATYATAILRNHACLEPKALDIEAMSCGAQYLIGTQDFGSFKSSGSSAKTSVRTVRRLEISKSSHGFGLDSINLDIEADGFLYNMVRIIAAALIHVGRGDMPPTFIHRLVEARDRKQAPPPAPPGGLYLMGALYPEPLGFLGWSLSEHPQSQSEP